MNTYAGIGSRETPSAVLDIMAAVASVMATRSWVLRSGGAAGADSAFERGARAASGAMEIFLPWRGFNGNPSQLYGATAEAHEIASQHHPVWDRLKPAVKKLHARNVHQILGRELRSPVRLVICYTLGGRGGGGTGQALRVARAHGIRIDDLGCAEVYQRYAKKLNA